MRTKSLSALLLFLLITSTAVFGQLLVDMEATPASVESNQQCFECHTRQIYSYENDWSGLVERKAMNPNYILDSAAFHQGVHRHFACTDCHSPEYESFPHAAEARLEPMYSCMDCHGGDETYEQYHFELIEEEFYKSVHSTRYDDSFDCWMCHDPHAYKAMTRGDFKISEIVQNHNKTCIDCHNDAVKFSILTDSVRPDLALVHEFIPNYNLHLKAVRCIECHTAQEDTMWVAHQILEKEFAVKKCVDCHSSNTMLMASLYKYQNLEARQDGFLNAIILNNSYVIGANRNYIFNIISIVLFGLALLAIAVHVFFRIKNR
ncbi:MAG: hypothetical protein KJ578_10855 [Bacteroidetes bacterium]|nr:hypothetical protein [Bacteroidota bacterium]MBU1578249.1 hypothetical protein [Bacteroidota bacterium]MBU2466210.1 hypothetical protein [Bacteroidota bacterium]MBU2558267.1 hypothetical protein [Bacteroidota bacterium]